MGACNGKPHGSSSTLGARNFNQRNVAGVSLVELVVFIVIVGVAVAGVLLALNMTTRASVDPLTQKQALAIAEALMEEVQSRAFTFCDPDDANAGTATSSAGCATLPEALGPEGETRPAGGVTSFDNVNDYHLAGGLVVAPISDITGAAVPGLEGYRATISLAPQALGGIANPDANNPQSILITVSVTGPGGAVATLDGYRVRYAPNALP